MLVNSQLESECRCEDCTEENVVPSENEAISHPQLALYPQKFCASLTGSSPRGQVGDLLVDRTGNGRLQLHKLA
jgi:hypothetical protein